MSDPGIVRRWLHHVQAVAVILLLASGWMIGDPDLRGRFIGGYGREILQAHLWVGWLLLAAPVLALSLAARPLLGDAARRLGPPDPIWTWRKVHLATVIALSVALSASGVLLWADFELPRGWLDAALATHLFATWVLAASIPVHLFKARGKIAARTGELLGRTPPPLHTDHEGNAVDLDIE
ncbi:MAG: cytochrome b/b6 domain-containing protein [Deltaproteobacteria bacterium]|nr:cytochrome b/b6 domain-containing protein [Deltaproteobacteria bacterium]MBW2393141.1 cytochrome b/b6 domain-containing protein [Deltaproteobacteria bacterium]